jgi:hypothetical protein
MEKENPKSSLFVVGIGMVMSIVRYIIRDSNELITIMAAVNIFALVFVLWILLEEIKTKSFIQIDKFFIDPERKNYFKFILKSIVALVIIVIFLSTTYIFLYKYRSNTGNDIMAILALCISIETSRLSNTIKNIIISLIKL